MSHQALVGEVEAPVTFAKEEAVGLLREAGIVGAGGAGVPTYVRHTSALQTLVVNTGESEPGRYADKLHRQEEPEALVDLLAFLKRAFNRENMIIAAETVARPYMAELGFLARELHGFRIAWIDPVSKYGQERALIKAIMGWRSPPRTSPASTASTATRSRAAGPATPDPCSPIRRPTRSVTDALSR